MATLNRVRAFWQGASVIGDGLSTFYVEAGAGAGYANAIKTFLSSQAAAYPTGTTITVFATGDQIDSATGGLVGTWTDTSTGASIAGTNPSAYALGVGMRVKWLTSGIVGGRRVVGSTFLVPIGSSIYDTAGTIANATVTSTTTAATNLVAAVPSLRIWSRPTNTRAGASSAVVSGFCPDSISWLRSRRT